MFTQRMTPAAHLHTGALALLSLLAVGCGRSVDLAVCEDYIACSEAVGASTATLRAGFGEDGTCWEVETEESCHSQCREGIGLLAEVHSDEAICTDGAGPVGPPECLDQTVATGDAVGDTIADYATVDQDKNAVRLYEYCDRAILILSALEWIPAMAEHVGKLNQIRSEFPESELAIVALVGGSDVARVKAIADDTGATFDMWHDPALTWGIAYEVNGTAPSFYLIKNGMVLAIKDDTDVPSSAQISAATQ